MNTLKMNEKFYHLIKKKLLKLLLNVINLLKNLNKKKEFNNKNIVNQIKILLKMIKFHEKSLI